MTCHCRTGNLLSLQCTANWCSLYLCPCILSRLLLGFCNAMIIACHERYFTRMMCDVLNSHVHFPGHSFNIQYILWNNNDQYREMVEECQ